MQRLSYFIASCLLLLSINNACAAVDPLSTPDMLCNSADTATYCGATPIDPKVQNTGCFEKVTVNGCNIILGSGHGSLCQWGALYSRVKTWNIENVICQQQKQWCGKNGYSDCQEVYQRCVQSNHDFRHLCLHTE